MSRPCHDQTLSPIEETQCQFTAPVSTLHPPPVSTKISPRFPSRRLLDRPAGRPVPPSEALRVLGEERVLVARALLEHLRATRPGTRTRDVCENRAQAGRDRSPRRSRGTRKGRKARPEGRERPGKASRVTADTSHHFAEGVCSYISICPMECYCSTVIN